MRHTLCGGQSTETFYVTKLHQPLFRTAVLKDGDEIHRPPNFPVNGERWAFETTYRLSVERILSKLPGITFNFPTGLDTTIQDTTDEKQEKPERWSDEACRKLAQSILALRNAAKNSLNGMTSLSGDFRLATLVAGTGAAAGAMVDGATLIGVGVTAGRLAFRHYLKEGMAWAKTNFRIVGWTAFGTYAGLDAVSNLATNALEEETGFPIPTSPGDVISTIATMTTNEMLRRADMRSSNLAAESKDAHSRMLANQSLYDKHCI